MNEVSGAAHGLPDATPDPVRRPQAQQHAPGCPSGAGWRCNCRPETLLINVLADVDARDLSAPPAEVEYPR